MWLGGTRVTVSPLVVFSFKKELPDVSDLPLYPQPGLSDPLFSASSSFGGQEWSSRSEGSGGSAVASSQVLSELCGPRGKPHVSVVG